MRKKFARIFVCIYVFFATLNRKLSIVMKKRLAEGICVGTLVLLLMISLLGSGVPHSIPEEQMMSTASVKKHNTVTNKNTTASIEIHNSEVAAGKADAVQDVQQGENSGKKGSIRQNTVSHTQTDGRNAVVENPVPLSQVQALYENNGVKPLGNGEKVLYQYPVEIGYAVDFNYDGKQAEADYLLNDVFETMPEKDNENQDAADGEDQTQDMDDEENTRNMEDSEEDARDTEDNGEQKKDKAKQETDKRITASIQFQKNVWNAILPTSPVEKSLSKDEQKAHTTVRKAVKKDEQKSEQNEDLSDDEAETGEGADHEGESEEPESDTEESEPEEDSQQADGESEDAGQEIVANAGYFTVRGSMRADVEAFVGDITIEPTGINGFDQVRVGEDGEFGSAVILTKDAADEKVTLYFSDGSRVTTGVDFTYSKDTVSPVLTFDEEELYKLQGDNKTIYCTNDSKLNIALDDNLDGTPGTGIDKLCYVYSDKLLYVVDHFDEAGIQVADDFYGRILMNCTDKAGNASDVISKYYLVEQNAPEISMAEDAICTTPYTLWVDVADTGHIISGIREVECSINGESYDISDLTLLEETVIDKGITVPSKYEFSLPFTEEGEYDVVVTVTDYAGNVSVKEQTITVEKPELVSVFMPQQFTIHIDPQQILEREQIFSDDITLVNNSEFDVRINIKSIELTVKDEVSDTGVKKDCNIYLVAPDTGEKIPINKGNSENVYSYCLPEGADGAIGTLLFVGETTEGSDAMWENTDIAINMELGFEKWREGEQ